MDFIDNPLDFLSTERPLDFENPVDGPFPVDFQNPAETERALINTVTTTGNLSGSTVSALK